MLSISRDTLTATSNKPSATVSNVSGRLGLAGSLLLLLRLFCLETMPERACLQVVVRKAVFKRDETGFVRGLFESMSHWNMVQVLQLGASLRLVTLQTPAKPHNGF